MHNPRVTYKCQECGKKKSYDYTIKCGGCNIKLCTQCSTYEFCPTCFKKLTP